jgi:hypothetical protein
MNRLVIFGVLIAALLTGACAGFEQTSSLLAPSAASTPSSSSAPAPSMLGLWTSHPLTGIAASSCTGFSWQVTNQTSTSLSGTFSATCANGIAANGTAAGQINGSDIPYTVTGTASVAPFANCPFSIGGTAHIVDSNTLRIPYAGSTCFGPVSGEETLRRPTQSAPASPVPSPEPAPIPDPSPAPVPAQSPYHISAGPLSMPRAEQVVNATADEHGYLKVARPTEQESAAAATELLRRVIWHLKLAGYDAGRQKNPSGAISGDKLTVFADGAWHAVDIFYDYGAAGVPIKVIFWEVFPANPVGDDGIPD